MRAALTVAPGRYSGPGEAERLLGPLRPHVAQAFGETLDWLPAPRPWLDFVEERQALFEELPDADVIVGFDLPSGVKRTARCWVDLRVHPVHFAGELWTVVDQTGSIDEAAAGELAVAIELQPRLAEYESMGAFACQVSFDTALMRNGRSIRPDDVMEGLRAFAHRFEVVFVAPSPREPRGPWVTAALSLPNAVPSPWPIYELLARVRHVCTVTSSVGTEAQYFGCETTWLSSPRPHGAALARLDDSRLWSLLFQRARRAA